MLEQAWQLSGSVALRPEPFGAMAYDFHTRRLTFLKTPQLVDVVRRLASSGSVREALDAAKVPPAAHPTYVAALQRLADAGILTRTAPAGAGAAR